MRRHTCRAFFQERATFAGYELRVPAVFDGILPMKTSRLLMTLPEKTP